MHDPLNAFCKHDEVSLAGSGAGPLLGLDFAAKDCFDVAGHRTGNGHPLWLATHPPAAHTASSVQRLLDNGARLAGKTEMDEMAYSLNGENVHYGTPVNPKAPGRIPGGSSSGSAAAVAGGLVDFALGTDCGGSIRLPASYCGIYGIRTSHGLVAADGVVPLAAGFDTVGWFACDAATMRRVGEVLLPPAPPFRPRRLLIAARAFAGAGEEVRSALAAGLAKVKTAFDAVEENPVYTGEPHAWAALIGLLQGAEIRANHGAWIDRHNPTFGPGIRERFQWTRMIDAAEIEKAKPEREAVARHMKMLLGDDALLCLPTSPGIAPRLATPPAELDAFRARAFALLSIAGLARLPQITLPVGVMDGCPIGLSLIAPRGCDRGLLDWVAAQFAPDPS